MSDELQFYGHLFLLREQQKRAETLCWFEPQLVEISQLYRTNANRYKLSAIPFRGAVNLFLREQDFSEWLEMQPVTNSKILGLNAPQTGYPAEHPEHH